MSNSKEKGWECNYTFLKQRLVERGVKSIIADLFVTKKNGSLVNVFKELPFEIKEEDEKHVLYVFDDISAIPEDDIIEIKD